MKVFISYAAEDRDTAEQIHLALLGDGYETFFDRENLPAAQDYHSEIRLAVEASDAFVFLISPEAVSAGSYTLTELSYARRRWPHPKGAVLPVFARDVAWEHVPNYLKSVTVLKPAGNISAEVLATIVDFRNRPLERTDRQKPVKSGWTRAATYAVVFLLVLAAAILIVRPAALFPPKPVVEAPASDAPPDSTAPRDVRVTNRVEVPAGDQMTVRVDATQSAIPYTVSLDGREVVRSQRNSERTIAPLAAGNHTLMWSFANVENGWRRRVTIAAGGEESVVLNQAHAAGDPNDSVGSAILAVVAPPVIQRFDVRPGERITVSADVGAMSLPYTISIGDKVIIRSLVPRQEDIADLPLGEHKLAWAFTHSIKDWHHRIALTVGARAPVTLEDKSESAGDRDNSVGYAVLRMR